jgi:hypothetical protein
MKALKFFMFKMLLFSAIAAQTQVTVNVNVGSPPPWGPVGYTEVRYYYLPDVESYYDIHASRFICFVDGGWVHRANLPSRYKNYDLYDGYKVVITDYHGSAPYKHFKENKAKYAKGYRGPDQKTIGEKPGKGHSKGKDSDKSNHDKSKSEGQGNGKSKKK